MERRPLRLMIHIAIQGALDSTEDALALVLRFAAQIAEQKEKDHGQKSGSSKAAEIERFSNPRKLSAYFGLNPSRPEREVGRQRRFKMTGSKFSFLQRGSIARRSA